MLYLSQSFVFHAFLFLVLTISPIGATTKSEIIEVTLNTPKPTQIPKKSKKPAEKQTLAKYAKSLQRKSGKNKVKPENYADLLKSLIDEPFYEMYEARSSEFNKVYTTLLLIYVDDHGKVIKVMVNKGSGNIKFDELALSAVKGAGDFPNNPPIQAVNEGILWSFSNGVN